MQGKLITRACGHVEPADEENIHDYGQEGESWLCAECEAAVGATWTTPDAILQAILDDGR